MPLKEELWRQMTSRGVWGHHVKFRREVSPGWDKECTSIFRMPSPHPWPRSVELDDPEQGGGKWKLSGAPASAFPSAWKSFCSLALVSLATPADSQGLSPKPPLLERRPWSVQTDLPPPALGNFLLYCCIRCTVVIETFAHSSHCPGTFFFFFWRWKAGNLR